MGGQAVVGDDVLQDKADGGCAVYVLLGAKGGGENIGSLWWVRERGRVKAIVVKDGFELASWGG